MNKNETKILIPEPPTPPPTKVELPSVASAQILNFDEIKPNSIIVIKINQDGIHQRIAVSQQIATALKPIIPLTKQKSICFILMGKDENIESLDEENMAEFGWYKKEKSLIITPR